MTPRDATEHLRHFALPNKGRTLSPSLATSLSTRSLHTDSVPLQGA